MGIEARRAHRQAQFLVPQIPPNLLYKGRGFRGQSKHSFQTRSIWSPFKEFTSLPLSTPLRLACLAA